jgi:hypothetical protein
MCILMGPLILRIQRMAMFFKVNGHCLKAYFNNFASENESISLNDHVYKG